MSEPPIEPTSPVGVPAAIAVPVTTLWSDPDAVLPVDAPMVADVPDPAAWPAALSLEQKKDLGRSLTQLLYGEPVQVVDQRPGWARVVAPWQPSSLDPHGYPGWVPAAHLGTPMKATGRVAVVSATTTRPLRGAPPELSYATVLPLVAERDDRVVVARPGDGTAELAADDVVCRDVSETAASAHLATGLRAVQSARRFLGLEYLWGGMSAFGLDCSGLMHITYRALGVTISRDAHDQAATLPRLSADEAASGDLLFFARDGQPVHHVGFATGSGGVLLHAPGSGNGIEERPMSDDRRATLAGAGRVVG